MGKEVITKKLAINPPFMRSSHLYTDEFLSYMSRQDIKKITAIPKRTILITIFQNANTDKEGSTPLTTHLDTQSAIVSQIHPLTLPQPSQDNTPMAANGNDRVYTKNQMLLVHKFTTERGKLFSTAYRILGNVQDAEDSIQEAYVRAWRKSESYHEEKDEEGAWLARIAKNIAIDALRSRKRKPACIDVTDIPESLFQTTYTPEDEFLQVEKLVGVRADIAKLRTDRITVLNLRYVHELSLEEIADRLGLPKNNIKSQLYRARSELKKTITEQKNNTNVA